MRKKIFRHNFWVVLAMDIFLVSASLFIAHMVRFDFHVPEPYRTLFFQILPPVIAIKTLCFYFFNLYRGMWRYTSISDMLNIIKASGVSSLIVIAFILFSARFEGFSRSVFIIDLFFTIFLISAFRLSIRFYYENADSDSRKNSLSGFGWLQRRKKREGKNLIIIGAGDYGEKICREIRNNPSLNYNVAGFLDDDPGKIGMTIHGIPVIGKTDDILSVIRKTRAEEALIALSSADAAQIRKTVKLCKESGIEFKTVPGYGELINGRVTVDAIREVEYRDLLGRDIIEMETDKIGAYLKNKTILVTGAGGSIGSELCRQICRFKPARIILYERAETPLYEIEMELTHFLGHNDIQIIPELGDVRDPDHLDRVFSLMRPRAVFHAAAYKHVPMLERHPFKAVENNIMGTRNVSEAAARHKIERFVLVSTDKAVRPANIMGASKRIAEMYVESLGAQKGMSAQFITVRFGNVAGSVGSVIPLFKKQIQNGGPVTVTHPDVTRFFMTIPEAAQLILQAGAMGREGEIFLLEMGRPIKIADMARDLISLSGFEPDVDIKIEYTGLRPGEKLYEELITDGEGVLPTYHDKIMVLKGKAPDMEEIAGHIKELSDLAKSHESDEIRRKLREVVPEYIPNGRDSR
ncbi:Capsular polysaccharide biosynthesis protein CapD [Candidatus Desulfarcum epimagneticum]|uniref:Capsular polysaccharide biosynthesis protein CapD n=1 Tax=uncultured Desulfobacteraceae bacterium TaxID=218296 RepID=A0A484HGW9_9BACT|nr:Capsular polysaccharide biosynthesis protein CapD [uncultured Desulfobacteraceae bacterium]